MPCRCIEQPHYVVLETQQSGAGFGLANSGFDGIAVQAGEQYDFSCSPDEAFHGQSLGRQWRARKLLAVLVRLETKERAVLGETTIDVSGREWQRGHYHHRHQLRCRRPARGAVADKSGMALDEISLFPHKTFKNRADGLRADLAQVIAPTSSQDSCASPAAASCTRHGLGNILSLESIRPD